jgi:hypothetical protein
MTKRKSKRRAWRDRANQKRTPWEILKYDQAI